MRIKLWHIPPRLATGAFVLNSGLTKRGGGEQVDQYVHGSASGAYPFLRSVDAHTFNETWAMAEIALGAALMLPLVPAPLAGAALCAFSGGLLGMYLRTEGMRQPGSIRPSQQGVGLAKDVWMLGVGLALVIDGILGD